MPAESQMAQHPSRILRVTEGSSLLFFVFVQTLRPALNRSAGDVKLEEKVAGATGLGLLP